MPEVTVRASERSSTGMRSIKLQSGFSVSGFYFFALSFYQKYLSGTDERCQLRPTSTNKALTLCRNHLNSSWP